MARRKRTDLKVTVGDVFAIPLGNNKYSYGQVVGGGNPKTYVIYDLTLDTHPNVMDIVGKRIIFFTHTVDVQIEDGEWILIGKTDVPQDIKFPEYVVDTLNGYFVTDFEGKLLRSANENDREILNTRKSVSPSILEDAVKAHYGVDKWYPYLDKLKYNH